MSREKLTKIMMFGPPASIDREARTIRGYSVIMCGEALGHGMWVDEVALSQVAKLGKQLGEIKTRYTHPGLCEDGLANQIGNSSAFRIDGEKVLADMVFYEKVTPSKKEKIDDVLNLAEEDPKKFGASIVFSPDYTAMDRFMEENVDSKGRFVSPDSDNVHNLPHVRVAELHASDVVGDPAANKDGIFGQRQALAVAGEQLFDWLLGESQAVPEMELLGGIEPSRVQKFFASYLQRHGVTFTKGKSMARKLEEKPESKEPEKKPEEKADDAPVGKTCKCEKSEGRESPPDADFCSYCGGKFGEEPADDKKEADDAPAIKKDVTPVSNSQAVADALAAHDKKQKAYVDAFNGIMAAAQFTAEERETFRTKRFGMDIAIVREFANEAVKGRSNPIGESGGIFADTSDADKSGETAELAKRFAEEPRVRSAYGCFTSDPNSETYKKALGEYVKCTSAGAKHFKTK